MLSVSRDLTIDCGSYRMRLSAAPMAFVAVAFVVAGTSSAVASAESAAVVPSASIQQRRRIAVTDSSNQTLHSIRPHSILLQTIATVVDMLPLSSVVSQAVISAHSSQQHLLVMALALVAPPRLVAASVVAALRQSREMSPLVRCVALTPWQ